MLSESRNDILYCLDLENGIHDEEYITEWQRDADGNMRQTPDGYYYFYLRKIEKAYGDLGLIPFKKLKRVKDDKGIKSYYIKGQDIPIFSIEGSNLLKAGVMTNIAGIALEYKVYYWSAYCAYDAVVWMSHSDDKKLKELYKEAKKKIKENRKK